MNTLFFKVLTEVDPEQDYYYSWSFKCVFSAQNMETTFA